VHKGAVQSRLVPPSRRIPEATVARLPEYLRILVQLAEQRAGTVSSGQLAGLAGVNAAKVRKDLSHLGTYGTRGVGYDVELLLFQVRQALGLTRDWPTIVVGAGNLGRALANYGGFGERGFPVVGVVDSDPAKVGTQLGPFRIRPLGELGELVRGHDRLIGIIATPPAAAQPVADLLVASGVTAILNFAPARVVVPAGVALRKVDLALELQILSFHQRQHLSPEVTTGAASGGGG
jgi:redox-sensing transcriptional repressor